MAIKKESERRLNLVFDELDMDVLDWLNSFGKRKRARIAKAALRRAMLEGLGLSNLLAMSVAGVTLSRPPNEARDQEEPQSKPTGTELNGSAKPEDRDAIESLLGLTGLESNAEILRLIEIQQEDPDGN